MEIISHGNILFGDAKISYANSVVHAGLVVCILSGMNVFFIVFPSSLLAPATLFFFGIFLIWQGIRLHSSEKGVRIFLPASLRHLIEERDMRLFWINFARDYNPVLFFLRLSCKSPYFIIDFSPESV